MRAAKTRISLKMKTLGINSSKTLVEGKDLICGFSDLLFNLTPSLNNYYTSSNDVKKKTRVG